MDRGIAKLDFGPIASLQVPVSVDIIASETILVRSQGSPMQAVIQNVAGFTVGSAYASRGLAAAPAVRLSGAGAFLTPARSIRLNFQCACSGY